MRGKLAGLVFVNYLISINLLSLHSIDIQKKMSGYLLKEVREISRKLGKEKKAF